MERALSVMVHTEQVPAFVSNTCGCMEHVKSSVAACLADMPEGTVDISATTIANAAILDVFITAQLLQENPWTGVRRTTGDDSTCQHQPGWASP